MLDLVNEALNQMPFLVEIGVIITLLLAIFPGWNDRCHSHPNHELNKVVRIIGPVSNQVFTLKANRQACCLGDIMPLTAGQGKAQRIPQGIHAHVDFGAEPASASSKCLDSLSTVFWGAPAAQGWARTTVLSSIRYSKSGSSMKWMCIRSQIPLSLQRAKRLYTLFQLPYAAGNKRHCAPLRIIHSTPSTNRRQSASCPTYMSGHVRKNSKILAHRSSDSFTLMGTIMPPNVNRT